MLHHIQPNVTAETSSIVKSTFFCRRENSKIEFARTKRECIKTCCTICLETYFLINAREALECVHNVYFLRRAHVSPVPKSTLCHIIKRLEGGKYPIANGELPAYGVSNKFRQQPCPTINCFSLTYMRTTHVC